MIGQTISAGDNKVDNQATDGLSGTSDSLAYRAAEVERHVHSYERWFGAALVPNGGTHVADSILTSGTAFQIDAGNNTWGSWLQILGDTDTPATSGNAYFDLHRLAVITVENANATHFMQIASGTSGYAGLTAGNYTEVVFRPQSVQGQETIVNVQDRRVAVGTRVWARGWVLGANTSTVDFFHALHEYEG